MPKGWALKVATSIHKDPKVKIRIVFSQDESTYFAISLKFFIEPSKITLLRETKGMGLMVSLLISRDFGWTFGMNNEQLKK